MVDTTLLDHDHDQEVRHELKTLNLIFFFSSKENKYVPAEQKILIDMIGEFQARLENVDSFDHVIMPPLYKQVVR